MKAVLLEGQAPGGVRTPLEECLPLVTPWVVQIFPIYACNFRCKYCHFSIPKAKRPVFTESAIMDMGLYKKCVDDMVAFSSKLRVLRFVGMGEPLLHKNITEMVSYAKQKNIAERVELLTNGSLLTREMSDRLISAGLDRLVVSLQGTDAEKYRVVSDIVLDFEVFLEQLRYFFDHKKQAHVYLKIVDIALDGDADRQRFFDLFGDICDSIGIETAAPHYPEVAYNEKLFCGAEKTQFGTEILNVEICPQPFFTMQINPDGKVAGCYAIPHPENLGDCTRTSVADIWNGKEYNEFRRRMLRGRSTMGAICGRCNIISYRIQKEDIIINKNGRLDALFN